MKAFKFLLIFFVFGFGFSDAYGQKYQAAAITFEEDDDLVTYFSEHLGEDISWKNFQKSETEQQIETLEFEWEKIGEKLRFITLFRSRGDTVIMEPSEQDDECFFNVRNNTFMEFIPDPVSPRIRRGQLKPLKQSKEGQEEYEKLYIRYGDNARVQVVKVELEEAGDDGEWKKLSGKKAFEVASVKKVENENVTAFAEENEIEIMHHPGYHSMSQNILETAYAMAYVFDVDGKSIQIRSHEDNDGIFSYSSMLEKVDENIYRAVVMNAFYEFHLNEEANGAFEPEKVVYGEYLNVDESLKGTDAYEDLQPNHEGKVYMSVIEQIVEEIPLDE